MMRYCWAILLICYYCYSENNIIIKEPGEKFFLKCSSKECITEDKYMGMYLYHNYTKYNEVYYYSNHVNSKIKVRSRYKGRIESNGAPMNHNIIMTNLTVDDSGVYSCVYKESVDKSVECKVYTVFVRGLQVADNCSCEKTSMIPHTASCPEQGDQHILVFIISTGVLGMLLIVVFILLIIQKVKHRRSGKIRPRRSMQESSDVYEVMTKSGPSLVSEHSSENPYEFD